MGFLHFHNNEVTANRGKLRAAEQALSKRETAVANSLLSGITPNSNIEENHKTFFLLVKKYQDDLELSDSDSTLLSELMSRCPFTDGSFIYQARAFYNKIYRVTKLFNDDNCISTGISSGRLKTNIEKYSDGRKQGFNLFPNPASETVFLSSNKSLEGAILTITDIAGKVLVNKVLGSSEDSIELSLNLIEGMYFVSIKKNNETANFKLVIAK